MDFDKTVECYKRHNLVKQWEQLPDVNRYNKKTFFDKVRSKRSGTFCQAQDLINRELVPADWQPPHVDKKGNAVKYPIEYVNEIIRKRLITGEEYLLSRKTITGLDSAGNPITISMNDKEWYDDILPIYKLKPENPRDRESPMIRELDHIEHRPAYTLPFNETNLHKLYDMRNGRCALSVTRLWR